MPPMPLALSFAVAGVFVLVYFFIRSNFSLDERWERHQRYLLRQGLNPVRTPQWDAK